ncbi:MAG: hypothetical protein EOP49_40990, partial [Sphingobacteriales bacterium]
MLLRVYTYLWIVKRSLLLACLLVIVAAAAAQTGQLPEHDIAFDARKAPEPELMQNNRQSYTEVQLQVVAPGKTDTTSVIHYQFDPSGHLISRVEHNYLHLDQLKRANRSAGRSRVASGRETRYTYDAAGNTTSQVTYNIYPPNSAAVLSYVLQLRLMTELEQDRSITPVRRGNERWNKLEDSLRNANLPGFRILEDSVATTYNNDNNPVARYSSKQKQRTNFTYRMASAKEVVRSASIVQPGSNEENKSRHQQHYYFDDRGRPVQVTTYTSFRDTTGDIARQDYFLKEQKYYHNKSGITDSVVFRERYIKWKHVRVYEQNRLAHLTLLEAKNPGWEYDTIFHQNYTYADNRLNQLIQFYHFKGRLDDYARFAYSYDEDGRLVQQLIYNGLPEGEGNFREVFRKQHLYFYGTPSDKST